MRIILRHSRTGLYYCGERDWADEVAGAQQFPTILRAAQTAAEQGIESVQVVIRYDLPECEFALPVGVCA